jgi:pyrroloquinoline quinone (PQQ) biosynthesis protein C
MKIEYTAPNEQVLEGSLPYLNRGTSTQFVDALIAEIMGHPALNHEYLRRLSTGTLPDIHVALQDYAHQYSFYTSFFTRYLEAVLSHTNTPSHRKILLENLQEENGDPESLNIEDRPHAEIFDHFKRTLGIDSRYEAENSPSQTVLIWRELFLQKCGTDIRGIGISAIGLATEFIVPHIYKYLIAAIEKHTDLPKDAALFFNLHVVCDGDHGNKTLDITKELASETQCRESIRFAVLSTLNLRKAFWDIQLARAYT